LKHALQVLGLGMVLALLASHSVAQDIHTYREGGSWGQEVSGSLAGVKNLKIKVDMGSVIVRGGQQQGIQYTVHTHFNNSSEEEARRQFDKYKISAYVKGDTAWIVGDWQGGHARHFMGEFSVTVPRDLALVRAETGGGNIEITGVGGRAEAESGGGKIRVDDIGGSLSAETGGDAIDVGTVGGEANLQTGGGNINVRDVKGRVSAQTGGGNVYIMSAEQDAVVEAGGGNVQIKQCQGRVKASTGGGNIELGDIGGPAQIETGGGSIRLASAKGRVGANTGAGAIELFGVPSAKVETGAGGITLKLVNISGGERHDSDLETGVGDITVYIASDVAINVRASVDMGNGHRITSDFQDIHVSSQGDPWTKTLTAEGKLNGGGPTLKVHTSTGDICIRKAGK
jgi:DUF4097 and DUF4098 domain-containing protein YvlB